MFSQQSTTEKGGAITRVEDNANDTKNMTLRRIVAIRGRSEGGGGCAPSE